METLTKLLAWSESKVRDKADVIRKDQATKTSEHFETLMGLCDLKDYVKHDTGCKAVVTAKVPDTISR